MSTISSTSVTFRLNNGQIIKDANKKSYLYIRIRQGRDVDFKASLKVKVLPNDWDSKKQRLKNRVHISNKEEINGLLDGLTNHIKDATINAKRYGELLTDTSVRTIFNSFFATKQKAKKETLFSFMEAFIGNAKTRPNHKTGQQVSKQTLTSYSVTRNLLKRFNTEVYKIDFQSINLDFYYDFIDWCERQGLSKNYIGKHIKTLKTFMREALETGTTKNDQFKSKKFVVLKEEADNIYLTNEELQKMWNLHLSDNNLDLARDLFLIGAYTGLRVSDYNSLDKRNIKKVNGIDLLYVKTQKTGNVVAIPLHPIVKQILEKRNWNAPPKMPDQRINLNIKEVGEQVGIDDIEYVTQTKGGKQITFKRYKFELIKTHTARRSFCTNAYLSGMNAIDIMAISGHKTEKAFLTYIKVTPEQTAIRMAEHPFFKPVGSLKAI